MNKDMISIVVINLNHIVSLEECLNSVVRQTHQKTEVLLVDIGSTDGSLELALQYAKKHEKIKVLENVGTDFAKAMNRAIQVAKGEYIQFVFPNIILSDNMCQELLQGIKGEEVQWCSCGFAEKNWNHISEKDYMGGSVDTSIYAEMLLKQPEELYYVGVWNKLYKTQIILEHNIFFLEGLPEGSQLAFNIAYLSVCRRICTIDKSLCVYTYLGQEENTSIEERIRTKNLIFEKLVQYCKENEMYESNRFKLNQYLLNYIVYEKAESRYDNRAAKRNAERLLVKKCIPKIDMSIILCWLYILQGSFRYCFSIKRWRQIIHDRCCSVNKRTEEWRERNRKKIFHAVRTKIHPQIKKMRNETHILLYCESMTMEPHIHDYYKCVKELEGCRLYIYYENNWKSADWEKCTLITSKWRVALKAWDLVVCADAYVPLELTKEEVPLLYVNHGLHMISYDNGENLYIYANGAGLKEDGSAKFTMMLEPNRNYAEQISAEKSALYGRIRHVGYKNADKIVRNASNYHVYREQLGVQEQQLVVAVFGSWNTDSLFHQVGSSLIEQAKKLIGDDYQFILSIHPKEYSRYSESIEPLGEYIESLRSDGFIVRHPTEELLPYMIAADVVICDYSTLCEEAMIAQKPVVLSRFPKERVWKNSTIVKYMERSELYTRETKLKEVLELHREKVFDASQYQEFVNAIMPPSMGYEEAVKEITKELVEGATYE